MAAIVVKETLVGIPCGNCLAELPPVEVVRGLLFEDLSDLPPAIRRNELNYVACNICGFAGWLWVGFICADLKRARHLFVFNSLDSTVETDKVLAETYERCSGEVASFEALVSLERLMLLGHYERLLPTLLLGDDEYAWELAEFRAYFLRQRMPDIEARARQLVDDVMRIGKVPVFKDEQTAAFLDRCLREVERRLAENPQPQAAEMLCALQGFLEEDRRRSIDAPSKPQTSDEEMARNEALVPHGDQLHGRMEAELENFIAIEARRVRWNELQIGDPAVGAALDKLDSVQFRAAPIEGVDSQLAMSTKDRLASVEGAAARLLTLLPNGFVRAAPRGEPTSTVDLVARAVAGDRNLQKTLGDIAVEILSKEDGDVVALATIDLLSRLAVAHGDIEATVACYFVASTYFRKHGAESARMSALANIIVITHNRARGLPVAKVIVHFIADAWRELGAYAASQGTLDIAALCMARAAQSFAMGGNIERELECRIDSLTLAAQLEPHAVATRPAEELLARLDGDLDNLWRYRPRLRLLIGDQLLRQAPGLPMVMTYYESAEGDPNGGSALFHNPNPGMPTNGSIHVQCTGGTEIPKVVALRAFEVPWLDQYEMAVEEALAHDDIDVVTETVQHVATTGLSLRIPEIARYQIERLKQKITGPDQPANGTIAVLVAETMARDARMFGRDTRASSDLRDAVDACVKLVDPQKRSRYFGLTSHLARQIGELLECIGDFDAAIRWHVAGSLEARSALETVGNEYLRAQLQSDVVRGYWRAARAAARLASETGRAEARRRAVELAEASKQFAMQSGTRGQLSDLEPGAALMRIGASNGAVIYSLLQETSLNDGYWMIAWLDHNGNVPELVLQDMEAVYKLCQRVRELFETSARSADRKFLDEVRELELARASEYRAALSDLGGMLLPASIAARLTGCKKVYLVPEAYLWDVPWSALLVASECASPSYLHAVEGLDGPITLSIVPNLDSIAKLAPPPRPPTPIFGLMHASPIPWQAHSPPIHGLKNSIETVVKRVCQKRGMEMRRVGGDTLSFSTVLGTCDLSIFSGHADIDESGNLALLATDGRIGTEEIRAFTFRHREPKSKAVVLCACAGARGFYERGMSRRQLAGVHAQLVQSGVRFVLGSTQPLKVAIAARMAELFVAAVATGADLDVAAARTVRELVGDPRISSPVFWGGIIGFGNGGFSLLPSDGADDAE